MEIVYVGVHLAVDFEGVRCQNGEPVEFPTAIALRALEQDCWETDDPSYVPPAQAIDSAESDAGDPQDQPADVEHEEST